MPKRYDVLRLVDIIEPDWPKQSFVKGVWHPAEPREYGGPIQRFLSAWEVFRGRARAVVWPRPEPAHD